MAFESGTVVRLKSGGPAMTVTEPGSDIMGEPNSTSFYAWFDQKNSLQKAQFANAALEKDD